MTRQTKTATKPAPVTVPRVTNIEGLMARCPSAVEEVEKFIETGREMLGTLIAALGTSKGAEIAAEGLCRSLILGADGACDYFDRLFGELEQLEVKAKQLDAHPDGTRYNPRDNDREPIWGLQKRAQTLATYAEQAAEMAHMRTLIAKGACEIFEAQFGKAVTITPPPADPMAGPQATITAGLARLRAMKGAA